MSVSTGARRLDDDHLRDRPRRETIALGRCLVLAVRHLGVDTGPAEEEEAGEAHLSPAG